MSINSTSSSNIVWNMNYSNTAVSTSVYTDTTNQFSNNIKFTYVMTHCRECNHAQNESGCYEVSGSSVMFVLCRCSEIVPQDNLEYLEYKLSKKESI